MMFGGYCRCECGCGCVGGCGSVCVQLWLCGSGCGIVCMYHHLLLTGLALPASPLCYVRSATTSLQKVPPG